MNFNSKQIIKYTLTISSCFAAFYMSLKVKDKNAKMAYAGLLGQMTTDFLFHPIDLVNTRTKYFFDQNLKSTQVAKRIKSTTGLKGFFRGGSVTLMGSGVGGFIYFYLYKRIKDKMLKGFEKNKNLYFLAYTVSASVSEVIVYLFYYPFDMIKTRIQTGIYNYKHFFDGVGKICDKNDLKSSIVKLYSGFCPSLVLSTSGMTLTFITFEITRDYYAKKSNISSAEVGGWDYFKCSFISGAVSAFSLNFLEVYTIQKIVHGKNYSFRTFMKPKHFLKAATSGLMARSVQGIFYTVCLLEVVRLFGKIYDVTL